MGKEFFYLFFLVKKPVLNTDVYNKGMKHTERGTLLIKVWKVGLLHIVTNPSDFPPLNETRERKNVLCIIKQYMLLLVIRIPVFQTQVHRQLSFCLTRHQPHPSPLCFQCKEFLLFKKQHRTIFRRLFRQGHQPILLNHSNCILRLVFCPVHRSSLNLC